jgi:hypothetical protein
MPKTNIKKDNFVLPLDWFESLFICQGLVNNFKLLLNLFV